jgi:hypothetical protein
MKTLLVAAFLFCFCGAGGVSAEVAPKVQKFELWDTLDWSKKLNFLMGFTNGLAASGVTVLQCEGQIPARRKKEVECILFSKELDVPQAIAMIDKYYKEHPEEWSQPIGISIMHALTVNGGPCADTAPKK